MLGLDWKNGQAGGTPLSAENLKLVQLMIETEIANQVQNLNIAKQDKFTETVDSHGWTVLNFGTHKEFLKKVSINDTMLGNQWKQIDISNLPTELTIIGNNVLTVSADLQDAAISMNVGCSDDNATKIIASCQNKYNEDVPVVARVNLRIIKIIE